METCRTVRQDLGDLCLDISLINRSTCFLKEFNRFAEVLDRLLISFLSKLVISLFFEGSNLFLKLRILLVI